MAERRVGDPDEVALVRAVADGSEEALAALYDRHVDGIHAVALRLTGDRQLAEEVVQETFLALWNRAELFEPATGSLATWLRAIARNRTVDRIRAAGRRPFLAPLPGTGSEDGGETGLDRLPPHLAVVGGAGPPPGPEESAEVAETRAAVRQAVGEMPDLEREVILLAYRDGLTQTEIAGRLGWPLGTVKTRTRRALGRLRAILETDGEGRRRGPDGRGGTD
jgi:RNA polymerase sigma-70 factor (ECF subfamily)